MNYTNQITETANATSVGSETTQSSVRSPQPWSDWLPSEIRSRHLPVESDAAPAEVIPWVHKFLKRHVELEIPEGYESHKPWKATLDDWNQFLTRLHDAEKQIFAKNSARNSKPVPTQRDPKCTESARKCTAGERQEPSGAQQETTSAQECACSGQSISTDAPVPDHQDADDEQPNVLQDEDDNNENDDNHDEDLYDTENDEDEDDDDDGYDDEDDDDAQLEADIEAELAGFEDDAHLMTEAAEDLKAELTGRNRFDRLTATQQAAIIAMLDSHHSLATVVRTIAKPSPEGLNFKISKSGLAKFSKRYKAREQERRRLQNSQAAADLLDKSEDPDRAFQSAFERLLTISSEPDAPLETIDALTSILTKLRKQSLAERKQLHAEKSKNRNASHEHPAKI